MPGWSPPYRIRRSNNILSFAVKQNHTGLEVLGEACYLLKRGASASATRHFSDRKVSTITQTASAYSYNVDPDTGMLRFPLWRQSVSEQDEYPDIFALTATVQASGSTDVWEAAVDKYSFVDDRKEFAFDIFRNQIDYNGDAIEDAMYVVFNTPPFTAFNVVTFNYGTISPAVDFDRMQPDVEDEPGFYDSLFGYEQWLDIDAVIRMRRTPHRFLLAFPGTATDLLVTDSGFIRESKTSYWTTPPNYSPVVHEWDVVVRASTGERYQIVNYTPIYVEDVLCSQHFDLSNLDPRSSIYQVPIVTG